LAVVGAGGNIGRACAAWLGPRFGRTWLAGRGHPEARRRLEALSRTLPRSAVVSHPSEISRADVVIVATNAVDPVLHGDHF
jgi:predicted amino acid dehydrogenase